MHTGISTLKLSWFFNEQITLLYRIISFVGRHGPKIHRPVNQRSRNGISRTSGPDPSSDSGQFFLSAIFFLRVNSRTCMSAFKILVVHCRNLLLLEYNLMIFLPFSWKSNLIKFTLWDFQGIEIPDLQ